MKATIVECIIGVFGFDDKNRIVSKILFPKDVEKIAEIVEKLQSGDAVDEILRLVEDLRNRGFDKFIFESDSLAASVHRKLMVNVETEKPSKAGEALRRDLGKIAIKVGYTKKPEEIRVLTHEISMALARVKVRRAIEKRDLLVVQAIHAADDLDKTINLFSSRIREWHGLHFPELGNIVDKHETYMRLVADLGDRSRFTVEALEKEGLPKNKAQAIEKAAKASVGADFGEKDMGEIKSLCRVGLNLHRLRQKLEEYIDETMEEVAPNVREIIGSTLGARLIAIAGGIRKLAEKPASTIQVLGAEKALFRSIRTGAKPPKHGVIFQYPEIHQSPDWQRGKIARALAGKLAIAARVDAYSERLCGEKLKTDLGKRIAEIHLKYREPPKRKGRRRRERKS